MGMKKSSEHVFKKANEEFIAITVEEETVTITSEDTELTHDEFREFVDAIGKIFTPIRKSRAKKEKPSPDSQPDTEQVANREFVESIE